MILGNERLIQFARAGGITPFREDAVQPASIDLTAGSRWLRHDGAWDGVVSAKQPLINWTTEVANTIVLAPGDFWLGETAERVSLPLDYAGRVEGKSSRGRIGLLVHTTAGFIDPGFSGVITLELANLSPSPIRIDAGTFICQLSLYATDGCTQGYEGRYQGADSVQAPK